MIEIIYFNIICIYFLYVCSFRSSNKSVSILCVQYLVARHLKNRNAIKKDDVMKTFKGRISAKNYDRVMEDVANTMKNVHFKLFNLIFNDKYI